MNVINKETLKEIYGIDANLKESEMVNIQYVQSTSFLGRVHEK